MSYNQPPNKPVVNDIMNKLNTIIAIRQIPFAFLVGGQPVFALTTLLKAETQTVSKIFCHSLVLFIYSNKCYEGWEQGNVLVAGGTGIIAKDSVDHLCL